jgi:hypothetical protein
MKFTKVAEATQSQSYVLEIEAGSTPDRVFGTATYRPEIVVLNFHQAPNGTWRYTDPQLSGPRVTRSGRLSTARICERVWGEKYDEFPEIVDWMNAKLIELNATATA